MVVVGGNLADIAANVARLRETGTSATIGGDSTKRATDVLHESIRSSTAELLAQFESIATELKGEIARSARQLESADWQGRSRDEALSIESELSARVDRLVQAATTSLERDAAAFRARADAVVGDIGSRFRQMMVEIEGGYVHLANAAEATRARFEEADRTIRGG